MGGFFSNPRTSGFISCESSSPLVQSSATSAAPRTATAKWSAIPVKVGGNHNRHSEKRAAGRPPDAVGQNGRGLGSEAPIQLYN